MTKHVFGLYTSEEEAINAVNGLELKGHKAKHITIFTNLSEKKDLKKRTDVNVQSTLSNNERVNDHLVNKFKMKFGKGEMKKPLTPYDVLRSFDISEEQAKKCLDYVKSGKVLVIIDDEMRMGHPSFEEVHKNDMKDHKEPIN